MRTIARFNYGSKNQEKIDANDYCIKDLAISRLMEREKCVSKAYRFVDYVFEKCRADMAPFSRGK